MNSAQWELLTNSAQDEKAMKLTAMNNQPFTSLLFSYHFSFHFHRAQKNSVQRAHSEIMNPFGENVPAFAVSHKDLN